MIDEFHVMYMYKKNPSRSRNYRHQNIGTASKEVPSSCW